MIASHATSHAYRGQKRGGGVLMVLTGLLKEENTPIFSPSDW